MPFLKSNSATAFFFSSSGSSFSLHLPANPTNPIPASEPITPRITITLPATSAPEASNRSDAVCPFIIGGRIVPVAAHSPHPIARPNPMPRYRTISPHVSPPMPQSAPKAAHFAMTDAGADDTTPQKSGTVR